MLPTGAGERAGVSQPTAHPKTHSEHHPAVLAERQGHTKEPRAGVGYNRTAVTLSKERNPASCCSLLACEPVKQRPRQEDCEFKAGLDHYIEKGFVSKK